VQAVSAKRRQRLNAADRKAQIVEAAFAMVAESGLERFRTRDVAERVGINPATLHHYFPTKEDLIVAVGEHLETGYARGRSRRGMPRAKPSALQALRGELADAVFYRRQRPAWQAVSREFAARAPRDPVAAAVLERLTSGWRGTLEAVLREGSESGAFRPDLDPRRVSLLIVSALWAGSTSLQLSDADFRGVCAELEHLVIARSRER
jgi:AcrR family transcriptional regulator